MALEKLLSSLRSKKQTAHRSAFGHYLEIIKGLAAGNEIDSDEVQHILDAAGVDENKLETDVGIQQSRLAWFEQYQQNRQAAKDRIQAEADFRQAQAALQAEIDKLQPAVDAAQQRMWTLDQIQLNTMQAAGRLSELVLDAELLEREADLTSQLRDVNAELKPLLFDLAARRDSLQNVEFRVRQLVGKGDDHTAFDALGGFFNRGADVRKAEADVADLRNQIQQLERAVQPRQAEQRRLQNELSAIHQEKLKP